MNRLLLIAVGIATFLGMALSTQPLNAQIYGEYEHVYTDGGSPYHEYSLGQLGYKKISAFDFALPPTFKKGTLAGKDDGYVRVDIGFPFEFNGDVYTSVWISVNGFITFSQPPNSRAKDASWLFKFNTAYPKNVIAPFWGDHFYITDNEIDQDHWDRYMRSEIGYIIEGSESKTFTVQWKDLNINDNSLTEDVPGITSSVANFQVKLIQSEFENSDQGDIQFCYGVIGGNTSTTLTEVEYKGASVGVKGENEEINSRADYLNALITDDDPFSKYQYNKDSIRMRTDLTYRWQPSGGSDIVLQFQAKGLRRSAGWGDGDVDMSGLEGNKHQNMDQSRFVTVNDARLVMRSVVTNYELDSVYERQAYHADVNHDGRFFFYYDTDSLKTKRIDLPWKNERYDDSLSYFRYRVWVPDENTPDPDDGELQWQIISTGINSPKRIFFQADEMDAAIILHYISARLVKLPWLHDLDLQQKPIVADIADGIRLGTAVAEGNNTYTVPVYINGYIDGPISFKTTINGKVEDVTATASKMMIDYHDNMMVIAGTGQFDSDIPVCYVTVNTEDDVLTFDNNRLNSKDVDTRSIRTIENSINDYEMISNVPNPIINTTMVNISVPEDGNYTVVVFDQLGNKVKTLMSEKLQAGSTQIEWDATDDNGNLLSSGMYVCRLSGNNLNVTTQMIIRR